MTERLIPEAEELAAFFAVMKRRTRRISKPGFWRVFRDDDDRVVFEALGPANDVVPVPPSMSPLIA